MAVIRRMLLEFVALLVAAAVVGFLGPFGTYGEAPFLLRSGRWLMLLAGAWVVIRPVVLLLDRLAVAVHLPHQATRLTGIVIAAGPLALLWYDMGLREVAALPGIGGVMLFTLLCSALVLVVAWWAERMDARLRVAASPMIEISDGDAVRDAPPAITPTSATAPVAPPRLRRRLSRGFTGDILALQSEDHYVRVHGTAGSELLLLRLRDAIVELDGHAGIQTHRSWWVAQEAIAGFDPASRRVTLVNGMTVPVARDTVPRLQRQGLLAR